MKSHSKLFLFSGILLCTIFVSCTTFKASGMAFFPSTADFEVIGSFKRTKTVHEFLGNPAGTNLFNISSGATADKVTAVVMEEIQKQGGNAAINIQIIHKASFLGWFLNWLTMKIWAPGKIIISGDVIKTSSKSAMIDMEAEIMAALRKLEDEFEFENLLLPDSENELAALDEAEREIADEIELVLQQAEEEYAMESTGVVEAQSEVTLK